MPISYLSRQAHVPAVGGSGRRPHVIVVALQVVEADDWICRDEGQLSRACQRDVQHPLPADGQLYAQERLRLVVGELVRGEHVRLRRSGARRARRGFWRRPVVRQALWAAPRGKSAWSAWKCS